MLTRGQVSGPIGKEVEGDKGLHPFPGSIHPGRGRGHRRTFDEIKTPHLWDTLSRTLPRAYDRAPRRIAVIAV